MRDRWNRNRPVFAASPLPPRPPKWYERLLPMFLIGLRRVVIVLGSIVLIGLIIAYFTAARLGETPKPSLPRQMVLYMELDGDPGEMQSQASLSDPFGGGDLSVHDIVDTLDKAALDPRVKGLMARMNSGTFAMARSEELRNAVKRFEAAGKFAYIYSPSYGEGSGDLGRYYLASAFQEIWMQPMGLVSVAGVRAEVPFARAALDKLGVLPQFYKRKEYKTAYESFTNNTMSEPNREELQGVVDEIKGQILKEIPPDRKMAPAQFEKLVNTGLFTAPEAVKAGLITKSDYADTLVERIKKDVTGNPEADDSLFVDVLQYAEGAGWESEEKGLVKKAFSRRPSVALIYIVGTIMDTNVGNGTAAADEIAPAILDAADDNSIKAIVLRVDSPGGSPVASESILRAVERAKKKGKPVIVSMGEMAASGGYWVSAYADQIFTMPTTLTGSIGVLGGKVSLGGLWKKIGVNWDGSIQWGQNAGMWSLNSPFDAGGAARMNNMLDYVYASFVARVAKGRGMTPEQVDRIAQGRVWTGAKAKEIGLADQIGGLREAMDYAAHILDRKDRTDVNIVVLPEPKSTLERFLEMIDGQGDSIFARNPLQMKLEKILAPAIEEISVLQNGYATYEPLRVE